jgi:uncharacterized protein DUF1761
LLGDLYWPAVLVATIAYFAVGGLWFSPPVFGKVWVKALGWEERPEEGPGPSYYIGPFITCLVATIATAMLAGASGSDTVAEGIALGLVTGVGLVGSALFVTGFFDPKKPQPMVWFAVTGSYHLVGLLVASVIVSIWKGA